MKSLLTSLLCVAAIAAGACNSTLIVRTDGPYIEETGISVPVPPPSLRAAPMQLVDIEGSLEIGAPQPRTTVFLYEGGSARGYFQYAEDDGSFRFTSVELDLTDNCIEVWYEEPGAEGRHSEHSFFTATIAEDDQSVITKQLMGGC